MASVTFIIMNRLDYPPPYGLYFYTLFIHFTVYTFYNLCSLQIQDTRYRRLDTNIKGHLESYKNESCWFSSGL